MLGFNTFCAGVELLETYVSAPDMTGGSEGMTCFFGGTELKRLALKVRPKFYLERAMTF